MMEIRVDAMELCAATNLCERASRASNIVALKSGMYTQFASMNVYEVENGFGNL